MHLNIFNQTKYRLKPAILIQEALGNAKLTAVELLEQQAMLLYQQVTQMLYSPQ